MALQSSIASSNMDISRQTSKQRINRGSKIREYAERQRERYNIMRQARIEEKEEEEPPRPNMLSRIWRSIFSGKKKNTCPSTPPNSPTDKPAESFNEAGSSKQGSNVAEKPVEGASASKDVHEKHEAARRKWSIFF